PFIPEDKRAFQATQENRIMRHVKEGGLLSDFLFGSLPGGSPFGLLYRPADCGNQSGKPVFEDVVGRPVLEGFNRYLFPHGSGDENKRHLRTASPGQRQCGGAIEGWKREVGEDQVKLAMV